MPTYEYACRSCGEHLEIVQSFRDDPLTVCPHCDGALRKVFSAAGIIFKGSGWHVKDYAGAGKNSGSASADGSAGDGDSSSTSSDTSSETSSSSSASDSSGSTSADTSSSTTKAKDSTSTTKRPSSGAGNDAKKSA